MRCISSLGGRAGRAEQMLALFIRDLRSIAHVRWRHALVGTDGRGARGNDGEPALQMREIVQVLTLRFIRYDPRVAGDIGDRIAAAEEFPVGEALVHHAIEAVYLLSVAIDRIRQLGGRIDPEVAVLPGHRPYAAD